MQAGVADKGGFALLSVPPKQNPLHALAYRNAYITAIVYTCSVSGYISLIFTPIMPHAKGTALMNIGIMNCEKLLIQILDHV